MDHRRRPVFRTLKAREHSSRVGSVTAADLITLKISNGALKGTALPTRLKVLAWGANESTKGTKTAGTGTSKVLAQNQRDLGYERVAIDFDHCTVTGTDTYKELLKAGQPPLIFGYGRPVCIPEDGTYLEDITWTPLGEQCARNFEDLSPAIRENKTTGEVDLIHSVALTPNGCVHGLQFFSATTTNNTPMFTQAELAEILGLSATADKPAVLAAFKARLTAAPVDITPLSAKITALEGRAAGTVDLTPLSARIDKLEGELTTLRTADLNVKRADLATLFARDGKVPKKGDGSVYTAEELKALDLHTLKLLHKPKTRSLIRTPRASWTWPPSSMTKTNSAAWNSPPFKPRDPSTSTTHF